MVESEETGFLQVNDMVENHRFVVRNQSQKIELQKTRFAVILPTLNAGHGFARWIQAFKSQSIKPTELLLIDSNSDDYTAEIGKRAGFKVHTIPRFSFSHGGTRQMGVRMLPDSEIILFLTQDAILAERDSLANLLKAFDNQEVGVAYGRQLPHGNATAIEAHARLFNYPDKNCVRSLKDIPMYGLKTSFMSNSFSAWRRDALMSVGGFPSHTIQNEDAWTASKLILSGWKIAYCADAPVYHSHGYTLLQEFRRYFDIGVFHKHDSWIREEFGQAEGEGVRYIKSELNYLKRTEPKRIPEAILRNVIKLIGYRLGQYERHIPVSIKQSMSSNRAFWVRESKI